MTKPQISYINSCYNAEAFLDGMIDNLLSQDLENFELIIVDSKSTDSSLDIAKEWQAKDSRIKIVEQQERTPYGVSWLDGWRHADGIIVANSNSDDRSYQWRGRKVIESATLRQLTDNQLPPAFYYGGYETRVDGVVTARGVPPPFSVDDMSQFFRCGVHIHWDNERLKSIVDFNKMYQAAKEYRSAFDYWMVLYFMSLGAEGMPINSCFSIYNQRKNSIEQSNKEVNTFESVRAIETFYPNSIAIQRLHGETKRNSPDWYNRYISFCKQFSS